MSRPILADAFAHHIWVTRRLIEARRALDGSQLERTADGTFGSVIDTLRHIAAGDQGYLFAITAGRVAMSETDSLDLDDLDAMFAANDRHWQELVAGQLDPDEVIVRYRDDGSESHAPLGVRIAQALHHGSDHRSQICTILSTLGVSPPDIDVWDFADSQGRLVETPPTA